MIIKKKITVKPLKTLKTFKKQQQHVDQAKIKISAKQLTMIFVVFLKTKKQVLNNEIYIIDKHERS